MATRLPELQDVPQSSSGVADALRSLRRSGVELLPGALMLLAFQLFAARSGALNRLQPPEQAVFAVSLVSIAVSIVVLAVVAARRGIADNARDHQRQTELATALLLTGVGALGGALAGDYFVAATTLTGSPGFGGMLGATILLLICVPWL